MDKTAVAAERSQAIFEFTQNTVYLMGASFVLGSLFTLFLLLILDFVRRNKIQPDA